jgi:Tol biopolymer transport system component
MKRRVSCLTVALVVGAGLTVCPPVVADVAASVSVASTARVSVDTAGGDPDGDSGSPSISADGRFVAFSSNATDLTPEGQPGVFVRDRLAATTTFVAAGHSPSISGDGRYVAYAGGNEITADDIFVRDLVTGTTTLVSVALDGSASGFSSRPSISADGRHVAFLSSAPNLVAGNTDNQPDVFVRHLDTGVTVQANVSLTGEDGRGFADYGAYRYPETSSVISADGRYVTFESSSDDLVADDTADNDIFVRDLVAAVTILVSDGSHQAVFAPAMSPDGSKVGYINAPFGLIVGGDVLVRDLVTGTTTKANVDTAQPASFSFFAPSFSVDGRFVAFESSTVNELFDNTPSDGNVYVRDLEAGITAQVSFDSSGGAPNGASFLPELSGDGRSVAYVSEASDLVAGDTNQLRDIFVTDLAVLDVEQRLKALDDRVVDFGLPMGITNSLTTKVRLALAAWQFGDTVTACEQLTALANQARAQAGKKLTGEQAAAIQTEAAAIKRLLGCA